MTKATKPTEAILQAAVMQWAMYEKQHMYVIPNSNQWFRWEADLLTVTRSELVHEFEIKVTMADFKRDALKEKHRLMGLTTHSPSYFWYVTCFEIEPPENAGWIEVRRGKVDSYWDEKAGGYQFVDGWKCLVRKEAPRRHLRHIRREQHLMIARTLSWRLTKQYSKLLGEEVE